MTESHQRDTQRLIDFLQDREAHCPFCAYDLRNHTSDVCPECGQQLRLTIGAPLVRFGWFIAAATPSVFSGIAAGVMTILIITVRALGATGLPPLFYLLATIGYSSGAVALALIVWRYRFVRLRPERQRLFAILNWAFHTLLFLGLLFIIVATA